MSEVKKQKIVIIVGPTASGKTGLSIELAKKFGGEVISADSRQVYKKLDIGTEKVSKEEMDGIQHHLIDVVDVETVYNASDYKLDAKSAISRITAKNKIPIIAGGTFFYIDVLLGRISTPEVPPNPKLRAQLENKTNEALYSALLKVDERRASELGQDNKRRLIRALEIWHVLRHVPKHVPSKSPFDVLMIGIETDRKELRERIRMRAEEALTRGLVEETKKLLSDGVTRERLSEIGLEYRIVMEYIDGDLTDEALIQKVEEKNWQYAKRQLTWLKRDDSIEWFPRENTEDISTRVSEFLNN